MSLAIRTVWNAVPFFLLASAIWFSIDGYQTLEKNGTPLEAYQLFQKGIKYSKKTDIKKALYFYDKAIEKHPNYVWAYIEKAKIFNFNLKQRRNAVAELTNAIEIAPECYDSRIYRGLIFLNSGEYNKAIADFNKALDIYTYSSVAYLNMADAYHHKGDFSKALSAYKSVLRFYPENKEAKQGRQQLAHSMIQSKLKPNN